MMESQSLSPTAVATTDSELLSDVVFRSPSELAALAEMLFRGVFAAGLLVSVLVAIYSATVSLLQPGDAGLLGMVSCTAIAALQAVFFWRRDGAYGCLRRYPASIFGPALIVGLGGWLTGSPNDQFFFVLTLWMGVLGTAVSLPLSTAAGCFAALGIAMPALVSGTDFNPAVFAAVIPPIFWLLINRLARFVLGLHQALSPPTLNRAPGFRDNEASEAESGRDHVTQVVTDADLISERASSLHDWNTQEPRVRSVVSQAKARLTGRQQQAVFYCCDGLEDAEIAEAMSISVRQVRRYLADARERTDTATREQLAAWAVELDLVP